MAPARPTAAGEEIAVVIPTHNTRDLTLRCLASLEAGSVRPAEVVIVDDGSEDGTAEEIASRYPEVHVLRNPRAVGFSAAVNRGLAETSSPVLLMLNSDTEVEPECLAGFARAFAADVDLGVAGATLLNPDGSRQWSGGAAPSLVWLFAAASGIGALRTKFRPSKRRSRPAGKDGIAVEWVAGAALALRRQVWDQCGPLDETFALYCQDLDVCLEAGRCGWTVKVLPSCRVAHHLGATIGQSTSDQPTGGRQDLEKLWPDLVRWAAKWRGGNFARKVAVTLRAGGRVRHLGLMVSASVVRGARRRHLRRRVAHVDRALRALRS